MSSGATPAGLQASVDPSLLQRDQPAGALGHLGLLLGRLGLGLGQARSRGGDRGIERRKRFGRGVGRCVRGGEPVRAVLRGMRHRDDVLAHRVQAPAEVVDAVAPP